MGLASQKHAFILAIREWPWTKENPFKVVAMEREALHKDRRLTGDEKKRLPAVCPEWLRKIAVFPVDTGCRGETPHLPRKNFDLEKGVVTIFGEKTGSGGACP